VTTSADFTHRIHDLLSRRYLLRSNAAGSRLMAQRFDDEADRINVQIRDLSAQRSTT
jgi:hypothetical protein